MPLRAGELLSNFSSHHDSNGMMLHKTDVSRLDRVIDQLSGPSEAQCDLLREHLESARTSCSVTCPGNTS